MDYPVANIFNGMLIFVLIHLRCVVTLNDKYFYCGRRIYCSDYKISVQDINSICNKILTDDRFMVIVEKKIETYDDEDNDNYYTRHTEEFLVNGCSKINSHMCNYGYVLGIYTSARKIRLSTGMISRNILNKETRLSIIKSTKGYFTNEKYFDGINKTIELIQSYAPAPTQNVIIVKPSPQKEESSSGFWIFVLFIICPCLCLLLLCAYRKHHSGHHYHDHSSDDVHKHLEKLQDYIKEIRRNIPPILSIVKCTICLKKIKMKDNYEMQNITTARNDMHIPLQFYDNENTRFGCGHVYHTSCLKKRGITSCLMCTDNMNAAIITKNTHTNQVIDEVHVLNLIRNFHYIYDRQLLEDYSRTYNNEFSGFDSTFALGLVGVWGITAIAATAMMMDNSSYQPEYAHDYPQAGDMNSYVYPSQSELEPDTVGEDF